ncbi:hypothetical protein CYMTET_26621 [Cymbomonas tetramitiformis]|uniref:Tetrapyrrole biosynthesis glutamyl-tRNA reductase dimerisation domain-containing protein n=1 Tax=Cymbomonas tetramitiformis TaxID=36881 RepID=A0AAE0FS45_9CHLO|nr:hypothetical protein CYMTET_26621 [Cymbomonas tetramitiformis]
MSKLYIFFAQLIPAFTSSPSIQTLRGDVRLTERVHRVPVADRAVRINARLTRPRRVVSDGAIHGLTRRSTRPRVSQQAKSRSVHTPARFSRSGALKPASSAIERSKDVLLAHEADAELQALYLISLRRPGPEAVGAAYRCWKWKEAVLGNGHDFFVPRPRTTRKLAAALVASSSSEVPILEALVLGNCERLDVYLCCATALPAEDVLDHIAAQLAWQIDRWSRGDGSQQTVSRFLTTAPLSWHDREGLVAWPSSSQCAKSSSTFVRELSRVLVLTAGPADVARYCCTVAMGLEGRPKHTYNPSSSRDAHIMLQLRRTLHAASAPATGAPGSASALNPPCGTQLGLILRSGLQAGKAARNPADLPQMRKLRGSSKGSGRYAQPVPMETALAAVQEAIDLVLEPVLKEYMGKLQALDNSNQIRRLRQRVEEVADELLQRAPQLDSSTTRSVNKEAQRLLHEPTILLRNGVSVNESAVVNAIEESLIEMLR